MKENKLIIFIIFNFVLSILCYGQSISQERKDSLISSLDNSSYEIRYNAIQKIIEYNIVEASLKIEQLIWKQEHKLQEDFLEALAILGSSKTKEYALLYIDSVDHYNDIKDPLLSKVKMLEYLFQFNDFSRAKLVFDLLETRNDIMSYHYCINLLPELIKHEPQYSRKAKSALEKIAVSAEYRLHRTRAIRKLFEIYGELSLLLIKKAFCNDVDANNRAFILTEYLVKYKNPEINSLFINQLFVDASPFVCQSIAEIILENYGSPEDYISVVNYNKNNPDEVYKSHINYLINYFKPFEPDSTIMINSMLDSLSSLLNQSKRLNWVGDDQYVNSLSGKLVSSKNSLVNYDSASAVLNIADFQNSINTVNNDSLNSDAKFVKREGWQFLYYYSGYILKRLPSSPAYIKN